MNHQNSQTNRHDTTCDEADRLLEWFDRDTSYVIAFSGGVDSAVVAKAAWLAVGSRAVAMTAKSPSLAENELGVAEQVAEQIGIEHQLIETNEFDNEAYVSNGKDRCFHCKHELYSQMELRMAIDKSMVVVNGTNADDLSDYRPGLVAATEHNVRSPLAELGLSKSNVRDLARHWSLTVWDKPASPCLSSRIAYGLRVTPERLRLVESAESFLRELGYRGNRVRFLEGGTARVELPIDQVADCIERFGQRVENQLLEIGFARVLIDPDGYRSGRLNDSLDSKSLTYSINANKLTGKAKPS